MKIRRNMLWKVPVFCLVFSWISFYLTRYLGRFIFITQDIGADGATIWSTDSLRLFIFNGVLFLSVLLLGGLWAFKTMTKAEIAVSATIASAIYFAIFLTQFYLPGLFVYIFSLSTWTSLLSSGLFQLTNNMNISLLLAQLAPFLFVPFGKKFVPSME